MIEEKKIIDLIKELKNKGHEAFIAGGAARDILSGKIPSDYDIVTSASYNTVSNIFKNRKTSVVGISFKICIVDGVEIATYRGESSQKKPELKDDLKRRDLTINAMAYDPISDKVIDISGGVSDLKNKTIRFNGSPYERINEDPLRIIRACRFLSSINGTFSPETFKALKENSHLIKKVAKERIRAEIIKSMKSDKPSIFFNALNKTDTLKYIFPSFNKCYGLDGGPYHNETVNIHMNISGDFVSKKKPLLRLASFLHDSGKSITASFNEKGIISFINHENIGADILEDELRILKFSTEEINFIKNIVKLHMLSLKSDMSKKSLRKLMKKLKDHGIHWKDWLILKIADRHANLKKDDYKRPEIKDMVNTFHNELKLNNALTIKDLKISGKEIIEIFKIKEGPYVGLLLNEALDFVIDNPLNNEQTELIEFLKKQINKTHKFAD